MATQKKENQKPVKQFRLHGVSASLFENVSEQGTAYHKVLITRTYKDGEEFKSASSFGRDDLPVVAAVANQAWLAIVERETRPSPNEDED